MEKLSKNRTPLVIVAIGLFVIILAFFAKTKMQNENPTPVVEQAMVVETNSRYNLMLGANPSVSTGQKYTPPTDSVILTNEAHLRYLIEKSQKRSTTDLR